MYLVTGYIMKIQSTKYQDGDVLNTLGIELDELAEFFNGFEPTAMLINRVTNEIRMNVSALENITLSILSDK